MKDLPTCCGSSMKVKIETSTYIEVECKKCGDIVYVKKDKATKPLMIDD